MSHKIISLLFTKKLSYTTLPVPWQSESGIQCLSDHECSHSLFDLVNAKIEMT